jgi:DNA-binding CsgD family transcriptional regulator
VALVTIDEFSRMVSAIHAAAITPEHWIDAMTVVRESLNATSSGMIIADDTSRMIKCASLPSDAMQAYSDYYRTVDYVLDAVERGPVGVTRGGEALVALNAHSEFNADWMTPHRMNDGLFVRLTDGPTPTCFLVASPRHTESFATPERVQLVNALIPHLQQALRTHDYVSSLAAHAGDVAEAVDGMRHAVIVVGPGAAVVHLNSAAATMLALRDGPCLRDGRLVAGSASADAEFQRSVARALGMTDGAGGQERSSPGNARSGNSFLCPRLSRGHPYVVHVTPCATGENRTPRALVVIVDSDAEREPPERLLRRLFGLTGAEADVACRLTRGQALKSISEELSLSIATVKTHLQHVFEKTATHRQAELVRLLLNLTP